MGPVHIPTTMSITIEFHSRAVERVIDAVQDRPDEDISLSHMGLPSPASVDDYFNAESTLRGGELISIGEKAVVCSDISLRPRCPLIRQFCLICPSY
jgi:hypothetical protein